MGGTRKTEHLGRSAYIESLAGDIKEFTVVSFEDLHVTICQKHSLPAFIFEILT